MGFLTLLFLAVGLAMDAFAVSVTNGMCVKNMTLKKVLPFALAFGIAQGLMPCIGWLAGQAFTQFITSIDHWLALILLGFIGGKMIYEAVKDLRCPEEAKPIELTFKIIILQAIATSIDALAVGISLAAMQVNILTSALLIAGVTFILCVAGAFIGKKFGSLLKEKAEILGGIILVLIGLKIFVEHVFIK